MKQLIFLLMAAVCIAGCANKQKKQNEIIMEVNSGIKQKADEFASFKLTTDLSTLTEKEKQILPLLFEAAKLMDDIFWKEAYGDKSKLLDTVSDPFLAKFININYGPWERLGDNKPFIGGVGEKPAGACFYPADMTKEEFEAWNEPSKTSLYTVITRDSARKLQAVPYRVAFISEITKASDLLLQASALAEDPAFKKYLETRAKALLTDNYFESDIAWLDTKNSTLDFVVGPIENYEDQLYGYKAAHEAYILVKDKIWSDRLARFAKLLPGLQKDLPCEQPYKNETPGSDSDLNVYDAVYYAGDCNAGSKTIAINLPNDEEVRAKKGSRKLQLKNAMQAKFDKIVVPISTVLIDESQRSHVKFDAFFENVMFHEVSHGLGLGNTVDKSSTVREALKDQYSSIEEAKADILGLWCVYKLAEMGELSNKDLMDNFVTFMAGIFRSVRFGAASAHGKANMLHFYYLSEKGAFSRNPETGLYSVDFEKMKAAMLSLSNDILTIQGDGNYESAKKLIEEKGFIRDELQKDLDRIKEAGIPRDIVFEQGSEVLGL